MPLDQVRFLTSDSTETVKMQHIDPSIGVAQNYNIETNLGKEHIENVYYLLKLSIVAYLSYGLSAY